uniref:NADH-ubiquinone oxidoreductase chain 2 n=1 Tax=Melophagus ovinus TaxID=452749 RepID=A0A343WAT1_9MUSC|nr:NADH dehydrogenase subunit 2 [Melophagus ovinus]
MFNNSSKIMFFFTLMMGSMISVSANSWLSAWMGLEINLLSFIPLMSDMKLMSTESSLKYFLIQALASMILLFSMISMYMKMNMLNYYYCKLMIISSLLMKMGSAPFHFWFPMIMEGLSWLNSLILMTWQKFAPLMLISYFNFDNMMLIPIILSSLIGSMGGLNQVSIRKLMAYSSINHLSWMLMSIMNNNNIWILYFLIYSLLNFIITMMFHEFKISYINQLTFMIFNSKLMKFFIFMNLLSLGGLPPFLGFFPKWLIIQEMVMNKQIMLMLILMMTTLISLFYYIRISYTTFLLNHYEINWIKFSFHSNYWKFILILSMISLMGLFLISSMYFFL